jgi:cyclic di-GMP phosphodiesterase
MIKKVKTKHLRPGVFVHDYNCDWTGEHIILSKSFINSQEAVDIICSWGIKEVYIDTDRGCDVESAQLVVEVQQETNKNLHNLAIDREPLSSSATSLKEEMQIARRIRSEAFDTIQQAMKSVREGKQIDVDSTLNLVGKMERSINRNKDALTLLTRIRKKDEYTLVHSISVSSLVLAYCIYCDIPHTMTMNLATGALLHDIGKTQIPDGILNKPGKLDLTEFDIMKKHAEYSANILQDTVKLPFEAYDIALHHHERYDGKGYPYGLKGTDIGFGARIVSICDVYDAITSVRCYKKGLDRVEGLRKLYEWSDHHFDKELTHNFIQSIGVYPIGTCVRLENELTAVVIESADNILQPVVRIFYNNKRQSSVEIEEIDLSSDNINIAGYDSYKEWSSDKKQIFYESKNVLSPFH